MLTHGKKFSLRDTLILLILVDIFIQNQYIVFIPYGFRSNLPIQLYPLVTMPGGETCRLGPCGKTGK
jgi:hypothetical protein